MKREGLINDISMLVNEAHNSALNKGWWNHTLDRREVLMRIISKLGEAQDAFRLNKRADLEKYYTSFAMDFNKGFEENIKDSFEAKVADSFIRILDYTGRYSGKFWNIKKYYEEELDALKGIEIKSLSAHLFTVTRSIQDIFYTAHSSQYIGQSLARLHYTALFYGFDLKEFVRLKMKYNELGYDLQKMQ